MASRPYSIHAQGVKTDFAEAAETSSGNSLIRYFSHFLKSCFPCLKVCRMGIIITKGTKEAENVELVKTHKDLIPPVQFFAKMFGR